MPRRTGPPPAKDDTFLWRICKALDEPPRVLAANIDVPYAELEPLLDHRHKLVELDRDEVWFKIREHVGQRLGALLAIRMELTRALQKDVAKRAARIAQMTDREPKGSPRGRR